MISKFFKKIKSKITREQNLDNLIRMGLKVGKNLSKQRQVEIDYSHCWLISIGDDVGLAARVSILAHDASTKKYLGYTKIGLVSIGNKTFIGAGSIILPNVNIGNNVIIAAGSVINKDVPDGFVVGGNPAKIICSTESYVSRQNENMKRRPIYDESWTTRKNITCEMKNKMINQLKNGIGYVE